MCRWRPPLFGSPSLLQGSQCSGLLVLRSSRRYGLPSLKTNDGSGIVRRKTARPQVQVRSPGVRYGGWLGWRRVRGDGGAGSGPRRCAVALEAAGQAAPPATARLPATPTAYGAALSRSSNASSRVLAAPTARVRSGPDGPARRRRALEDVEKVVTDRTTPVVGTPYAQVSAGQVALGRR